MAADREKIQVIQWLLKNTRSNVNYQSSKKKETPLHRAVLNNDIPMVKLLLQQSEVDIHIKDVQGRTPLDRCRPNQNVIQSLLEALMLFD